MDGNNKRYHSCAKLTLERDVCFYHCGSSFFKLAVRLTLVPVRRSSVSWQTGISGNIRWRLLTGPVSGVCGENPVGEAELIDLAPLAAETEPAR